jgi:hypothetical protein
MTSKFQLMVAALAATVGLAGCSGATDDDSAQAVPSKISVFEGRVDPLFVGTWKSKNGNSTIQLGKDGALNVETISFSPAGKSDVKVSGQWLIKGDSLTLKYTDNKNHQTVLLQYKASLSGNKLKLDQGGGRLTTIYTR